MSKKADWLKENESLLNSAFWGNDDGNWHLDEPDDDVDCCDCCGLAWPATKKVESMNIADVDTRASICLLCALDVLAFWEALTKKAVDNLAENKAEILAKMVKDKSVWVGRAVQH